MRRLLPALALAFLSAATVFAAAVPFPQATSDLKPDPAARFGALPNGLRYVLRANKEPKDRASLRLLIEAGSAHERDGQQGLAHFLEHLAFNGSEHYPPGTLIEFFQRMGMNFGNDTNASTGFNRTLYLLELPDTKPATLAEGLKVFRDYAGGLLLRPEEIDRERGIILSERRSRDSVGWRTFVAQFKFLLGDSLLPRRLPIGEKEVIEQAKRDTFEDFYNTWYRPELMTLVAVGDFDVAALERDLVAGFSGLKPRGPARPAPDYGQLPDFKGTHAHYHYESEAPSTSVSISTVTPFPDETDTAANRLKDLPRRLADSMINRRLSILAKKENAPFISGSSSTGDYYRFLRQASMSFTCRADQWEAALGVADQELRRALRHGFQQPELDEVVANFRNSLQQAVKTAPTRRSAGLADEISEGLVEREVFTSPEADLALYGPALDKITVADCLAALRAAWAPAHRLVLVSGNAKLDAPAPKAAIAAAYEKTAATPVAAPAAMTVAKWAYTDFGPAGKVVQREHIADLDVHLLTFENGVRLNLKKTDFEANRIRVGVRIGHGRLTEPKDKPGLSFYLNQTYNDGGLGKHSADDLRRVLAGRTVSAGLGAGEDAFTVGGGTNREDLLLQLQLVAARITDPGFRPEAARQVQKTIDQIYLSFAHTASGPLNLEIAPLLASGDPRFGLPPKDIVLQRTLAETKAWIMPELASGPMEIAIVGDIDLEATVAAVAQTLGTLPKRGPHVAHDSARTVKFPAQPFTRHFAIETEIPKGTLRLFWPTTDGKDIRRARRLNLLGEVFNDRLRVKVREELGDAYSPGAGSSASDVYPGYGYMAAGVEIDPPRAQQVADIIVRIAADLAEKGVTAEELDRAKKPILTNLRESARTNQYWLGSVLARAQERPEALDWSRTRYSDNEAITAEELSALAKSYLGADRASRVTIVPAPKKS